MENVFIILDFCRTYRPRETSSYECAAASGGGRNDVRGQGLRGFDRTGEATTFVHRRGTMIPHRDPEIAERIPSASRGITCVRRCVLCASVVDSRAKQSQSRDKFEV
jgi:hypothetical protein